jgi:hypothetical protein
VNLDETNDRHVRILSPALVKANALETDLLRQVYYEGDYMS